MKRRFQSRKRKESRTIPIFGDTERGNGLDDGRYYRCWNCGFICNKDRDALGGPESRDGINYEDFPIPVYGADTAVDNSEIARLGGSIANQTLVAERIQYPAFVGQPYYPGQPVAPDAMQADDDDFDPSYQSRYHHIKPVVGQGCPFCGSLNWRGDY